MKIEKAERLKKLPPYLFKELDKKKADVAAKGVDIIDLGVGDPDMPTPSHIVKSLQKAATNPENQKYPSYSGMNIFKESAANWLNKRFNLNMEASSNLITLIGSKEGIAHLPLALINPGDIVLIPDPAYPVYLSATVFAGGEPYLMPLLEKNNYLPDFEKIPENILEKTKLMFLNYPNNPTSAVADIEFFENVVAFAKKHNITVCHDAAYTEMYFDEKIPPSFLQAKGAMDVGIEFHSLSKTYNMTGWRIGFAAGNPDLIQPLGQVKSNIDSGVFDAIQYAGISALEDDQSCIGQMMSIYNERRDVLLRGLADIGLSAKKPEATFYIWIKTPGGTGAADFSSLLLEKTGILATPGNGFGKYGEGYIRMALTVGVGRLKQAIGRMKKAMPDIKKGLNIS